ncbi:MAG: virulence RhuM family protein [Rhodocyclaceae bacterium]|nr:virulence RhuM family protein [Rhodocyclaceae bacterium]MBK6553764.1 virulence RhuM family protein [Rhodocyclaceae bacterium]MBK6678298.1 virulence RhuM family protein [Rhodocyclaceae bacterium]MBK9310958.1 virulence RhuM family protein [Rhodocyclaceae bacterium]MBK9953972.1 virulence RhuM family protein [Rhodocyclaceae bacterium]
MQRTNPASYNLDAIISVGYRVKSPEGVRFRQWASRILKNYLVRGYALDRRRLETNAQELECRKCRKRARSPFSVQVPTMPPRAICRSCRLE